MKGGLTFGVTMSPNTTWDELVRRARHIEAFGFETLWLADHIVSWIDPRQPRFDAWTALGALATQVPRIRLGTLVTHATYRNPVAVARAAITVDHVSGGRLELGLGAGGSSPDHRVTGVPEWSPRERVQRFRELVEIVDRILRGEAVKFQGEYYGADADFRPLTPQRPRPPLTIAALGNVALKIAVQHADRWSSWAGGLEELATGRVLSEPDGLALATRRNQQVTALCERTGRDPATLIRSLLAGWPQLAPGTPWTSMAAFEAFIEEYRAAGFEEFVFVWPPEEYFAPGLVEEGLFERVATEVLPRLRRG